MAAAGQATTDDENITLANANKFEETEKYDWTEVIRDHLKILVVGDQGCGKTCLILSAKNQSLPDPEESFLPKQYPFDLETLHKMEAQCMVVDVDARDEMKDARLDVYRQGDVFLLCFAVDDPKTFENISEKWMPEVQEFLSQKCCILVGLKQDTRSETEKKGIPTEKGHDLKDELKCHKYMECSAYNQVNVLSVFQEVAKVACKSETSEK